MARSTDTLEAAREAYARRDWATAREAFMAARSQMDLSADDLYALGDCAWWLGRIDETIAVGEEAYRRYLQGDRPRQAATSALDLAVTLFLRGDHVIGSGWMRRAQRLLVGEPEGVEHGYLLYLDVESALAGSDRGRHDLGGPPRSGHRRPTRRSDARGRRDDGGGSRAGPEGQVSEGMTLLDEVMVALLSEELSPEWAGNLYCHLMAASHELADIRRAGEWTDAMERWLDTLPAAVLFTGICRVHRSQVLQTKGAWERAEREAARVCDDLVGMHVAGAAEGYYQVAEIRRLRGDLAAAEESYGHAHRLGRDPQPGLAMLRLAQKRVEAAAASIRAALIAVPNDRLARFRLLAAQVEIALAAGDVETARRACDELGEIASTYGSSGLEAAARHARGAVALAEGSVDAALPILRDACRRWQELDAPYDAARVRILLARAYAGLRDEDAATRELDAAEEVLTGLGAIADVATVAGMRAGVRPLPGALTAREAEVLALVAAGGSNRDVARSLVLSEKTVARHLSNIFAKLGVGSRTEAAAFAFEHGLAWPRRG